MLKNYLVTSWRNLQRNKIYSAINISGIAIGLAAFWLIALYVMDELSYDKSFTNSDRICRIVQHASWSGGSMNIVPTAPAFATTFKNTFPEVEDAARLDIEGGGIIKYGDKILKQNDICVADNSFFKLFDYPFLYGNAANALAEPGSIVITKTLAAKIFGDASAAMDQSIRFGSENAPVKVTGVIDDMPMNSHLQFSGIRSFDGPLDDNGFANSYLYTYLLLKKGNTVKNLESKLPALEKKIAGQMKFINYKIELQPLTSIHLNSNLDYELSTNGNLSRVYMFIVIGVLIVLIALINFMNLSTARAAMRVKEIGIRKVVGSSQKHLVGLFIAEALLVNFIAAVVAFFLVQLSLPFFSQLAGKTLNLWQFGLADTLLAVAAFLVLIVFISGSYPALFFSRFKMISSLKGQLGNVKASIAFRKSLVVFQFVIAVLLISSSFIIYKQLQYVSQTDLGFNKEQVLSFHIDNVKVRSEIPALKHELLQSPLIEGVAIAGNPIGNNDLNENSFDFEKKGETQPASQLANKLYVDEDFLQTSGISLLKGRNFSKDMPTDKENAIIINETLMKILGYEDPVGKKMSYHNYEKTIVGVVKDFHAYSLQHKIEPLVLMMPPNDKEQDNVYVKIAKGKSAEGIAYLKTAYRKFDNDNTADFHFLDENFAKQYIAEQKQEKLTLSFTVLAFIIACLGLLGLVIFATAQRTKEIGIRKVLGASVASVTIMLGKDFAKLVAIATVIAIPIAWFAMNQWLQGFAYRISIQWWMFLFSGFTAILIALITVSIQSVRAAITNPVNSLRSE